ncbi:MAG TPA: glucosamine-6-phosphate deaminase [Parafilimonas sp.]|nr:glucosamine-6-phosphate deaminase [Parafilimonas sp.]
MKIEMYDSDNALGKAAAKHAAQLLRKAIETNGSANIILATGTSQFETLSNLINEDVDWSKISMFHLDEYIGLPIAHAASFRKYLQERFISKVDLKKVYLINGETNAQQECKRLGELITQHPIDVALIGIGENGHLAFNDPPADFETEEPYIIVELDNACRQQQMNEGWFNSIDDVPQKAISMSVKQIMKSKNIICSVPGKRKAVAVKNCLENTVSNLFPASILQTHMHCIVYLDKDAASLLSL